MKNLNLERAKKIIIEASEQCGRGDVPELNGAISLEKALQMFPDSVAFDLRGKSLLASQLASLQACQLLIGPEGGWSEKELELFKDKNIKIFKLGNLTLRAETAAIVTSSIVLL